MVLRYAEAGHVPAPYNLSDAEPQSFTNESDKVTPLRVTGAGARPISGTLTLVLFLLPAAHPFR